MPGSVIATHFENSMLAQKCCFFQINIYSIHCSPSRPNKSIFLFHEYFAYPFPSHWTPYFFPAVESAACAIWKTARNPFQTRHHLGWQKLVLKLFLLERMLETYESVVVENQRTVKIVRIVCHQHLFSPLFNNCRNIASHYGELRKHFIFGKWCGWIACNFWFFLPLTFCLIIIVFIFEFLLWICSCKIVCQSLLFLPSTIDMD